MVDDTGSKAQPKRETVILEASVAAIVTVVCGVLAIVMPALVEEGGIIEAQEFIRLSPIFFPRMSFLLTALTALVLFIRSVRNLPPRGGGTEVPQTRTQFNVLVMTGIVLVYSALLVPLGYGFATLVIVAIMTYFLGNRSWWQVGLFALLAPIVTRFIFERVFSISLPRPEIESLAAVEESLMQTLTRLAFWG